MSRFVTYSVVGLMSLFGGLALAQSPEPIQVDIGAQPVGDALNQFAEQSGLQVVLYADDAKGIEVTGVSGEFDDATLALDSLLASTGLEYSFINDRTVAVASVQKVAEEGGDSDSGNGRTAGTTPRPVMMAQASVETTRRNEAAVEEKGSQEEAKKLRGVLEEITVLGTRIKGARLTSPVVTITQEEMRLSGHNNLGEVIRALPQNFAGGQNPGVTAGAEAGGALSNQNVSGGSSLNLRGLGPGSTLTLLNGARLTYDGIFQATDVASIPTAAIERMDILLDGASAIYGSDAVAGVANIVLKRDYEGAELSARFGVATDGGYEQQQYTAIAGTNWGSGGFLITGDYSDSDSVKARQRDYLSQMQDQDVDIYPEIMQQGALVSGHQKVGAIAEFRVDAFYTTRTYKQSRTDSETLFYDFDVDSSVWGVAPSLDFELPGEWSARLHGAFGRNDLERSFMGAVDGTERYLNGMQAAGVGFEGPLFALPGGAARASIGGGWRRNSLDQRRSSGRQKDEQSSYYVYGEVNLPLVSEDQEIPLIERLALNAAVRFEDYDTFGESTTPKLGAIWTLTEGLDLKASWGRSFKTPTLLQQRGGVSLVQYQSEVFVGAPEGLGVFFLGGGNPDIGPEEAEVITAGFVANPEFLPGFTLEFDYFDIDYTDRVVTPISNFIAALSDPAFAEFVTLNPTIAQQNAAFAAAGLPVGTFTFNFLDTYDPAEVIAILENRYSNALSQRAKGVDLIVRYATELFDGNLSLSGNGNWITDGTRRVSEFAPEQPTTGVNFWPAKFKGRLSASWSREGLTLNTSFNYIAGIIDRNATPNVKRDSMTTVDFIVDYRWNTDLIGDVGVNLAITNLLNEAPPLLQPPPFAAGADFGVSYDSTNYSALGRVVNITLSKRF